MIKELLFIIPLKHPLLVSPMCCAALAYTSRALKNASSSLKSHSDWLCESMTIGISLENCTTLTQRTVNAWRKQRTRGATSAQCYCIITAPVFNHCITAPAGAPTP